MKPLLGEDHAATPITARIKAMVTAAMIQHHEEAAQTLSSSRVISSWHPTSQDRDQGSKYKSGDVCSHINCSWDACNVINNNHQEWEDEEYHRRDDERERFGVYNNRQHHDNRHDHRTLPRRS